MKNRKESNTKKKNNNYSNKIAGITTYLSILT
jgi:hypothetical protein